MLPQIDIRTIRHADQRYETCGDYYKDMEGWHFRISDLGRPDWEFLILVHELSEAFLCHWRGISWGDIDAFDVAYENARKPGDDSEPGDSPEAPYHNEHRIATKIERALALALTVDWGEYEKAVDALHR